MQKIGVREPTKVGSAQNPVLEQRRKLDELFIKCDAILDENDKIVSEITIRIQGDN